MSKQFRTQDYFRYKKLGKRWRKPVGLQSKLRLKKGGSGMKVAIGYGTPGKPQPMLIRSGKDFEKDCSSGVLFASSLGAKKTAMLAAKAKELDLTILNRRKVRRAMKIHEGLKKRKQKKEEKKTESKTEKKKDDAKEKDKDGKVETEMKETKGQKGTTESKMGFHESVVPRVISESKTKTYRLRDHGFKVGDMVAFENSQNGEIFGHGKIKHIERTTVGKINLKDTAHYKTYDRVEQLIEALKRHHPEKEVTPETETFVYIYEFVPNI